LPPFETDQASPRQEPGRNFACTVVPSAGNPHRHLLTTVPAVGTALAAVRGASETAPSIPVPSPCEVTTMTPVAVVAIDATNLLVETDDSQPHPLAAGNVLELD
jgi:hypothetical protein